MSNTHKNKGYTGHRRERTTHWSVIVKDRLARSVITIGGLGTIIAVSTVCVFLIAVAVPLFRAPEADPVGQVPLPQPGPLAEQGTVPVHVAVDDYNLMAWAVYPDGIVRKFRLDNGEVLDEVSLIEGHALTAWSFPQRDDLAVLGYADGSVRYAALRFGLGFIDADDAPPPLRGLEPGDIATFGKGIVQMTNERQLRHVTLDVELQNPVPTGSDAAVVLLDHTGSRNELSYSAMTADGRVFMQRARGRRNLLTGETIYRTTTAEVPYEARQDLPAYVKMTGLGDNLYLIWRDGILRRFDTRDYGEIRHVETVDLSPAPRVEVSSIGFMIGKTTLLVGDTAGNVAGWFRVRPDDVKYNLDLTARMRLLSFDAEGRNRGGPVDKRVVALRNSDGFALVPAIHLPGPAEVSPVRSLSASQRKRMFVVGHENGLIRVHNATVQRTLVELTMGGDGPVEVAAFNPRDDGLIGVSRGAVKVWHLSAPHSEAAWAAYFRPIWYEGYPEPRHVWQSTGGTDDFESKFGLMPLVFGTIKATFYSMLFAIPLALLAAIYTSEFLHPRLKARVKPAVEMMASLPSVVLGFLGGLVIAQFVETRIPSVLLSFLTIPFALATAATLWQILPRTAQIRMQNLRFLLMVLVIPVGIWMAAGLGPVVERSLFSVRILDAEMARQMMDEVAAADVDYDDGVVVVRDFRTWLNAHRQEVENPSLQSSAVGGWMMLFTPLSMLMSALLVVRFAHTPLIELTRGWSCRSTAWLDLAKFALTTLLALVLAYALSQGFSLFWDPRGGFIDHYVQRNALVVGFMMGFAVVPIIYTIADDAMSAVPEHLRSASLGAGATRWQTAVRIVVPTAMSGLFSAVMIGFGRAVGETMIVLMAAGNTPIMEWNIFSGFRTLSANIAVEMMEAVEGSTNYRTLFLAAVMLFTMTFIINTVAETVRQRYRRKAYQL